MAENEQWGNNATNQFCGLFSLLLGGTEAGGIERLAFLDSAMAEEDPAELQVVVHAFANGTNLSYFSRTVGPELHGSRPALESWQPATGQEIVEYITGCAQRLAQLATRDDSVGEAARSMLGQNLRSLILRGYIDIVESAVHLVGRTVGYWHEAHRSLRATLAYDSDRMAPQVVERIEALIEEMKPESFEARMRASVTELPMVSLRGDESYFGDSYAEQYRQHEADAAKLATELREYPEVLSAFLPKISQGRQHNAYAFGKALGSSADADTDWIASTIESLIAVPKAERNFDLLAGYVVGLAQAQPDAAEEFKQAAALNDDLAYAFLLVSSRLGITVSDIALAIGALESGALNASQLRQWAYGGVLRELLPGVVAPLFDALTGQGAECQGRREGVPLRCRSSGKMSG